MDVVKGDKGITSPEIDSDKTAIGLAPVTSAVY
jgi:hypothetical protein